MGAATKRPVLINQARSVFAEQGTRAVVPFRHRFATRGPQRLGREYCLAPGELRGASGQLEMATLGEARAGPLDRTIGHFPVDGADFLQRLAPEGFSGTWSAGRASRFHK